MRGLFDRSVLGIVFGVSLLIFWWGAAPWLTYHDSGEFALAAAVGGIPHAPGAPTYCVLAWGFVGLARLLTPLVEAAYLTNLFSGLCGALTITLTVAVARHWNQRLSGDAGWLSAFVVPGVLLGSAAFVEQSCVTEQYTLLTALLMGALLVLTKLSQVPKPRLGVLLGLLIGLAIGNHPSQVMLVPLLALAALCAPKPQRSALLGLGFLGLVAGLLVFLYLPLRSRVNPAIDFGNVETWERFRWAIQREQWQTRPLSAAPQGFAQEWLVSYDFLGQLGIAGTVLAFLGMAVLGRQAQQGRQALALVISLGVVYGGGLLVAHLRQVGIDLAYLRDYGVIDWHIPLYTLAALLAAIGAEGCTRSLPVRFQTLGLVLSVGLLLWGGTQALTTHSLRNFDTPKRFVTEALLPLPQDALIVTSGDNLSLMLGFCAYGSREHASWGFPGRWVLWGMGKPVLPAINAALLSDGAWTPSAQAAYLTQIATENPPYHAPLLSSERAQTAPLFVEFSGGHAVAAQHLRPAGWLFEVCHKPVSDDEARITERQLHDQFPTLFLPPTGRENRLEREARGLMHLNRGAYFFERALWPEAAAAYTLACAYLNRNASAWFCLGSALESQGQLEKAREAYLQAIEAQPELEGPHLALGILLAQAGQLEGARGLFAQELALSPKSEAARANLALVTQQLKSAVR